MITYVNTHFAIEKIRDEASQAGKLGPRVLIVGPSNAGKTSLAKLLTAYALRAGRQALLVNTDTREGVLSIPGSLTATSFASIIDVEEGWGSSPTSGPSSVPVKLPLCYYCGFANPEDEAQIYKPIITRLSLAATSRLTDDPAVKECGLIIDTAGALSQSKSGYDIIAHMVSEFSGMDAISRVQLVKLTTAVNVVLCLGSERLFSDLQRRFSSYKISTGEEISIIKLDKSGGCVDRDETFMQESREAALREYFFGNSKRTLSPHTQHVDFDELTIYKVRESELTVEKPYLTSSRCPP